MNVHRHPEERQRRRIQAIMPLSLVTMIVCWVVVVGCGGGGSSGGGNVVQTTEPQKDVKTGPQIVSQDTEQSKTSTTTSTSSDFSVTITNIGADKTVLVEHLKDGKLQEITLDTKGAMRLPAGAYNVYQKGFRGQEFIVEKDMQVTLESVADQKPEIRVVLDVAMPQLDIDFTDLDTELSWGVDLFKKVYKFLSKSLGSAFSVTSWTCQPRNLEKCDEKCLETISKDLVFIKSDMTNWTGYDPSVVRYADPVVVVLITHGVHYGFMESGINVMTKGVQAKLWLTYTNVTPYWVIYEKTKGRVKYPNNLFRDLFSIYPDIQEHVAVVTPKDSKTEFDSKMDVFYSSLEKALKERFGTKSDTQ